MTAMEAYPAASDEAIIEVEHVSAGYGAHRVLEDVSLQVRRGEIMVIMGGSGSGKSTLLRCLLGLHRPCNGMVRLYGRDIAALSGRQWTALRKKIGVAFQGGALFNSMSVGENVCLPLREHTRLAPNTMQIISRMKLEMVNLAGFEHLMPAQLSGGMLKRAALARALVMDPGLVFFDEPSAGLDPIVAADLDNLILRIREATEITLVVVTHELESAFKIADRITVLDRGRVLMTGSVAQVRDSTIPRLRNLLTRTAEQQPLDAEQYLRRLTGGTD